ncbi:MAG TPA: NPCBM/NEW2 domain-containing protein [Polyangiaceae bacterium]|nr:NPCBM/NEW2 domain-containing protein [Polyangiaceae bacterium]
MLGAGCSDDATDEGSPGASVDEDFPVPLAEGLAPTPPMGWNSWNQLGCGVTAERVRETADAMVESGMAEAGYQYINVDDCWSLAERDADGALQPAENFPEGIAALADYVHERGLKLGIYGDRGTATCAGRAGSSDYEARDAQTFAAWGVDFLKYDNCAADPEIIEEQYTTMRDELVASGRDMVYSLCAWNFYEWGVDVGHLWRTTSDILPTWDSIVTNMTINKALAAYSRPNGWNDPDMLEVGVEKFQNETLRLTDVEARAHFSIWAIMSSPLIAGNDLVFMLEHEPQIRDILTNKDVIAINQDALGYQGVPVATSGVGGELEVWAKPINESGGRAVVLLNKGETPAEITVELADIGLAAGQVAVTDLWAHVSLGTSRDRFTALVEPHEGKTLKLKGSELPAPKGEQYLSDLTWTYAANGLGPIERDMTNGASAAGDGQPIALRGQEYAKGLGVGGPSVVVYRLGRACTRFSADVGISDDTAGNGTAIFQVFADGEKIFDSDVVAGDSAMVPIDLDVTDRGQLKLTVMTTDDGKSWDRAVWADARVVCGP